MEEAENWVYLGCVKFYLERTTEEEGQGRRSAESKPEEKGSERVVGTEDVDWRFQCDQLFPRVNHGKLEDGCQKVGHVIQRCWS